MIRALSILALVFGFTAVSNVASARDLVGVGIDVSMTDGKYVINSILPESPASRAQTLMAKDEIIAIQSTPDAQFVAVSGMTEEQAGNLIHGDENVAITFQVKREGSADLLNITIVRGKFSVPDNQP